MKTNKCSTFSFCYFVSTNYFQFGTERERDVFVSWQKVKEEKNFAWTSSESKKRDKELRSKSDGLKNTKSEEIIIKIEYEEHYRMKETNSSKISTDRLEKTFCSR
jgi:hypothetical protein